MGNMRKDVVLSERIDRNGTKHQIVETNCSRCGGAGFSDRWKLTGRVCYQCGGDGRMNAKRKVYTPEHAAKLEARRQKREEKRLAERREKAKETNKQKMEDLGFHKGTIHMVLGDIFSLRKELKEAGAKHISGVGYYFTDKPDKYPTAELNVEELVAYTDYGAVYVCSPEFTKDYIKSVRLANEYQSQYVGKIGDKLELDLTVMVSIELEGMYGYTYINKMQDEKGNIFMWKTQKNLEAYADDDKKIKLKGTVKDHTEYREEKQTVLTRCKVVEG